MKKLLFALLALPLLWLPSAPASAACGVNNVPAVGVICDTVRNPSYSATSVALVPASSATDIFCISGSATKTISIRRIRIGGTAGTAITTPVLIYQRSALDTGGTAATGIALPVPVPLLPTDAAATAVTTAYTANPTVASSPLLMSAATVDLPVTTASGGAIEAVLEFGTAIDFYTKGLDIPKNTTLQYCVNLNGATVSSGLVNITMQWQEN